MEVPGGIEPRTILPPLRTRLEVGWRDRDLDYFLLRQLLYPAELQAQRDYF